MKYCQHCGNQLNDNANFCDKCGNPVNPQQPPYGNNPNPQNNGYQGNGQYNNSNPYNNPQYSTDRYDAPDTAFLIVGIFLPIVGLILYLVYMNSSPLKAKSAGKGAIIGVIIHIALYALGNIISMFFAASIFKTLFAGIGEILSVTL